MAADLLSILIVGDSHVIGYQPQTFNLTVAETQREISVMTRAVHVGGAYVALDSIVIFPDGRRGLNPAFESALAHWPGLTIKGRPIDPVERVNKHLVLSLGTALSAYDPAIDYDDRGAERLLFKHDVDFVLPGRTDLPVDPACTVLPAALIREMFRAILEPLNQALAYFREEYPRRIWIIGCPPPSETNQIKERTISARILRQGGEPPPLPSPLVSLKVWLLVNEVMRAICKENGVGFVDCSPIACNEAGFLRPEFEHDGVHGNARYNDLMARHLVSTIGTAEAAMPRS